MKRKSCGKCAFQRLNLCRNAKSGRSDQPVNKTTPSCDLYQEARK